MRLTLKLCAICVVSACSQTEPIIPVKIPETLLKPVTQPVMTGETKGDLWRLVARQKKSIAVANSQLASISCLMEELGACP